MISGGGRRDRHGERHLCWKRVDLVGIGCNRKGCWMNRDVVRMGDKGKTSVRSRKNRKDV